MTTPLTEEAKCCTVIIYFVRLSVLCTSTNSESSGPGRKNWIHLLNLKGLQTKKDLFVKSKGLQTDNSCSLENNHCLLKEYQAASLSVGTSQAYSHLIHKQPLRAVNRYSYYPHFTG